VFNHGFLTFNGKKISKSLGNAISASILVKRYGADAIRYFCLRHFPFGDDGDFSEDSLIERHNSELADKLGNLVSRVSALVEKYGLEETEPLDISETKKKVEDHLNKLEFDKALNVIFAFVDHCNEYVQTKKPWETKDTKVLYQLSNAIKDIAILLSAFIPETSEKISEVFNFEINYKGLNDKLKISKIKKAEVMFKKIEND
jgi:methionyl-tRNA synthetase